MTLIIAYPHSDAACLLNSTVGVVFPLRLPNIIPVKKIEVLLGLHRARFLVSLQYHLQRHLPNYRTPNGIIRPVLASLLNMEAPPSQDHFSGMSYV
jgi:hypothetical protein